MGNNNCCTTEEDKGEMNYNIKAQANVPVIVAGTTVKHLPDGSIQGVRPIQAMNRLNQVVQEVYDANPDFEQIQASKYNHLVYGGPYLYSDGSTYEGTFKNTNSTICEFSTL